MAKDFESLKQQALVIKNEVEDGANSSERVGGMLEDIVESMKLGTTEFNVSAFFPTGGTNGSNKYDLASAIGKVPAELRTAGVKVSFLNESGNVESWEFSGGSWAVGGFSQVGSGKLGKLDTELKSISSLFSVTENLALINNKGKYINESGNVHKDDDYNSSLIQLEPGATYYIHQQLSSNNIRVFQKVGDTYTQVASSRDAEYEYTTPSDGNEYWLQTVIYLKNNQGKLWVSKDKKLTKYIPPLSLKEFEEINVMYEEARTKINVISSLFSSTKNLALTTRFGGFINESGNVTYSSNYNSSLIQLEPGAIYYIHQQLSSNNIRVFQKVGDTYTQVASSRDAEYEYTTPSDGNEYWLQTVELVTYDGDKLWVSKGKKLTKYIPPLGLKELHSIKNDKEIKVLAIGNSYSRDAFSYVPFLLENILGCKVKFGIMYKGSCTLQQHYNLISTDGDYEAFDYYTTDTEVWSTVSNKNIEYALSLEQWDIITLQQQSSASRDYNTYQPYLNNVINLLYDKIDYSVRLGWLLTPSYTDGYSGLNNDTSDSMFEKICQAVQRVIDETPIEFFIPCGTAKQNATKTTLNSLGDYGGMFYEGLHLQEGIPCLVEAYVAALKLMELLGYSNKGLYGNQIRPTQEKVVSWNVPQRHGESVGVNDDNCRIAQLCAIMAFKKPLEVTDMTALVE